MEMLLSFSASSSSSTSTHGVYYLFSYSLNGTNYFSFRFIYIFLLLLGKDEFHSQRIFMNNSRCIILHRGLHYCRTSCVFGQTMYLSVPRLLIYEYALSPSVGIGYCYWICDREHSAWCFDTITQLCPNKTQP